MDLSKHDKSYGKMVQEMSRMQDLEQFLRKWADFRVEWTYQNITNQMKNMEKWCRKCLECRI